MALSPPPACPPPPGEEGPYPVTPMQIFYNGLDSVEKAFWNDGTRKQFVDLMMYKLIISNFSTVSEIAVKWAIDLIQHNSSITFQIFEDEYFNSDFEGLNSALDYNPIPPVFTNPPGYNFEMDLINISNPPQKIRTIGMVPKRGNTEDLQWGTNGDPTGISSNMLLLTNDQLFNSMEQLISLTSQGDLEIVAMNFINKFREKTGGVYTNPTLNGYVNASVNFKTFISKFGVLLDNALHNANWDINNVPEIQIPIGDRPKFGGFYNLKGGLQILINDTEETVIDLVSFSHNPTTHKWTARLNITIKDHFGLDKKDAVNYQGAHSGFAAWWILQHMRGYKPFETNITFTMELVADR